VSAIRRPNAWPKQSGAVLLIVILLIGLLAAIATSFVVIMRSHTKSASNTIGAIRAEALANTGVQIATLALTTGAAPSFGGVEDKTWVIDPGFFVCSTEHGSLAIWVEDEGGKVDLNAATPALLIALFRGGGTSDEDAERIAAAIVDFRDADNIPVENGAEADDYIHAGMDHGPKNRPFETTGELAQVLGVDNSVFARLAPFITVHSRRPGIDPGAAPRGLVELLLDPSAPETSTNRQGSVFEIQNLLPPGFVSPSARRAFTVVAQARTKSGSLFTREAVLYQNKASSLIKEWRRGRVRDVAMIDLGGSC
jgi:general secretion pathway protein K